MTVELGRICSRVGQMSRGEVRTRLAQEIHKRLDLIRFRVGLPPARPPFRAEGRGTFFFPPARIPARVALLRDHLAEEAEEIVREADQICQHRFRLLGYENLNYGPEIDWHLDVVGGKRAPLKPWYRIRFLDAGLVGDHKVIWELNRHQHLVTLAKAWRIAGDRRYFHEIFRQWEAWHRANPYPLGINWASSLEVAFRSLSWIWLHGLLAGDPELPRAFEGELIAALALHGRHIERYLSTYFSPNTHFIGEAVGLFSIGTLYGQIRDAERWRALGWRTILEESKRQVRSDGVYFEQSLYYHVYALDFFLHARILAERNQVKIPPEFDETLIKMLNFVHTLSQAGVPDGFGDDDGGRVFNARRNRAEHMRDPLAVGAVLYGCDRWKASGNLTEEALWLMGEKAVSDFGQARPPAQCESSAFEAGGIFVMASCDPFPQQMEIDAGPQGTGHSGHGHADALSLRVSAAGRRWLTDRGTGVYLSTAADERDAFRGTRAHNTLTVDGLDQAVPQGPFAWGSLPSVAAERWIVGETFRLFVGSHDGYSRLPDPVIHRRFVFHLKGGFWLVRDVADGKQMHDLVVSWHFAPDLELLASGGAIVAQYTGVGAAAEKLALVPAHNASWVGEVSQDFASPAYGKKESAGVFTLRARLPLPAESATVVVPFLKDIDRAGRCTEVIQSGPPADRRARAYRYDESDKVHLMVFGEERGDWQVGPWTSDARFFYCSFEQDRPRHLIACHASHVELRGETAFAHPGGVERWELVEREGTRSVFSSQTARLSGGERAADLLAR